MSQLTIDSELKRVLGIKGLTQAEINALENDQRLPSEIIRAQVMTRCVAWHLSAEDSQRAVTAALEPWWKDARSIAWCVETGWREAMKYKTPEPHFCRHSECRGLARCPSDPVCND